MIEVIKHFFSPNHKLSLTSLLEKKKKSKSEQEEVNENEPAYTRQSLESTTRLGQLWFGTGRQTSRLTIPSTPPATEQQQPSLTGLGLGHVAQEVERVGWSPEGCRFDPRCL